MNKIDYYCGYIGIFGKQNVGKSTILNKLIENKVSITSRKPGTTQKNILGIQTKKNYQIIYIDTPGMKLKEKNNYMLRINNKLSLILFVVNKNTWSKLDELILNKIQKLFTSTILVINKIDCITQKIKLLPYIEQVRKKHNFMEIIPISAKFRKNIDILSQKIKEYIPKSKHLFPKKCITNVSSEFIITEIIREKIIRLVGKELPYLIKIKINSYKIDQCHKNYIDAFVIVKNNRHKKIIIGKNGEKIKLYGIKARKEIEKKFNKSIYLKLWVKIYKK
ncbi:GTPase Era [Buchnera aphidicola]|uniref:GTPase Era n=1 Tax=Buchnera aphidicola TaxID=9 RepID=UPI0034642732